MILLLMAHQLGHTAGESAAPAPSSAGNQVLNARKRAVLPINLLLAWLGVMGIGR